MLEKRTIILHVTKAEDVSKLTWVLGLREEGMALQIGGVRFRSSCSRMEREGLKCTGHPRLQKQRLKRNRAL